MTVPPTFGWEDLATVLVLLSLVALASLVVGAVVASMSRRSEWQGYLGARSSGWEGADDDVPGDASPVREPSPIVTSSSWNR
jgi:hypothetical protein